MRKIGDKAYMIGMASGQDRATEVTVDDSWIEYSVLEEDGTRHNVQDRVLFSTEKEAITWRKL